MLKFIFCLLLAELQARASEVPYLRNHPRNFAPQAYQCKITQSTGMATQMQLEVILTGNRPFA